MATWNVKYATRLIRVHLHQVADMKWDGHFGATFSKHVLYFHNMMVMNGGDGGGVCDMGAVETYMLIKKKISMEKSWGDIDKLYFGVRMVAEYLNNF